jgi:Sigma-70 factor, region 1.1
MDWNEVIREIVALGEAAGFVTFDQINGLIPAAQEAGSEDISRLMAALSAKDINIVEE